MTKWILAVLLVLVVAVSAQAQNVIPGTSPVVPQVLIARAVFDNAVNPFPNAQSVQHGVTGVSESVVRTAPQTVAEAQASERQFAAQTGLAVADQQILFNMLEQYRVQSAVYYSGVNGPDWDGLQTYITNMLANAQTQLATPSILTAYLNSQRQMVQASAYDYFLGSVGADNRARFLKEAQMVASAKGMAPPTCTVTPNYTVTESQGFYPDGAAQYMRMQISGNATASGNCAGITATAYGTLGLGPWGAGCGQSNTVPVAQHLFESAEQDYSDYQWTSGTGVLDGNIDANVGITNGQNFQYFWAFGSAQLKWEIAYTKEATVGGGPYVWNMAEWCANTNDPDYFNPTLLSDVKHDYINIWAFCDSDSETWSCSLALGAATTDGSMAQCSAHVP